VGRANAPRILQANALDLEQAATHGISETMQDRLRLTSIFLTSIHQA
jgi:glutamate-5-semialdehyde dehydrogenase